MSDKKQPTEVVEGEVLGSELAHILNEQGVSPENQKTLAEAFGAPFIEAGKILEDFSVDEEGQLVIGDNAIKVTAVDQVKEMSEAREKRLQLRAARITVENKRKELKEESIKTGRAIDAVAKFVKNTIEPAEKYLETQEKFKELTEAKEKAERMTRRTEAVAKYTDPAMYNLEIMADDQFDELVAKLKKEDDDRIAAERKAEEDRQAAAKAERERIAKVDEENKRLEREAAEQKALDDRKISRVNRLSQLGMSWDDESKSYKALTEEVTAAQILDMNDVQWKVLISKVEKVFADAYAAEQAEQKAIQDKKDEELRKEREAAEAERKKRAELEQAEADRKAAEEKAKADAAEAERQALLAPDKDKVLELNARIEGIRKDLPATKTKNAQDLVNAVDEMFAKMQKFIEEKVKEL